MTLFFNPGGDDEEIEDDDLVIGPGTEDNDEESIFGEKNPAGWGDATGSEEKDDA